MSRASITSLLLLILTACGDSLLYHTLLPNSYRHTSNGGEFGSIDHPKYGLNPHMAVRKDKKEKWCNNFSWLDKWVVCELYEYGDRAFVDPPKSIEYLILDTSTNESYTFTTLDQAKIDWVNKTRTNFPKLKKFHTETKVLKSGT